VVVLLPSKQKARVRFPPPAPNVPPVWHTATLRFDPMNEAGVKRDTKRVGDICEAAVVRAGMLSKS
jgi:hypothetical protein